jgi:hypothetical protein
MYQIGLDSIVVYRMSVFRKQVGKLPTRIVLLSQRDDDYTAEDNMNNDNAFTDDEDGDGDGDEEGGEEEVVE